VAFYSPIIPTNKGAEHRNICRIPQKIKCKVQRTEPRRARRSQIYDAPVFTYIVHFSCIRHVHITSYSADYMLDVSFSADSGYSGLSNIEFG
jgi:hypothetical protein